MRIDVRRQLSRSLLVISVVTLLITVFGVLKQGYAQNTIEPNQIRKIIWSPNGDKVAVSYQNGQVVINGANREVPPITLHGDSGSIFALSWSPDGNFLASGSTNPDHTLRIWNAVTGEQISEYSDFGVDILTVAWSPDSSQVIAVTAEGLTSAGNAIVVDLATKQATPMSFGVVSDIEWSLDGPKVAFATIGGISIRDAANFQPLFNFSPISREIFRPGLQNQLVRIAWSPDEAHIAGGMGDGRVFLWELGNPEPINMLVGNDYQGDDRFLGWIYDLHFDSTGQMLTSVSGDGTIRTWELQNGMLLAEQITSPNYAANFSPYGARIALGLAPEAVRETATMSSNTVDVIQTLADGAVQIVVPAPSLERLQAIANACNAPASVESMLPTSDVASQLSAFVSGVEALSADTIPPGCAADLLAVAQALQEP